MDHMAPEYAIIIILKELYMSDLFSDTMKGLLQALDIEKGDIPVDRVPNLPAETYRYYDKEEIDNYE